MSKRENGSNVIESGTFDHRSGRVHSHGMRVLAGAMALGLSLYGCADPGTAPAGAATSAVVNGAAVSPGEYTSTVAWSVFADGYAPLTDTFLVELEFACTATVIASRWVLTARHCVKLDREIYPHADLGPVELRNIQTVITSDPRAPGVTSVIRTHIHPSSDVAVGLLASPQPGPYAYLASDFSQVPAQQDRVTIVGYGRDEDGQSGVKLQGSMLVGFRQHEGDSTVLVATRVGGIYPNETPQAACHGDSGGPVFDNARNGASGLQFGVASRGDCDDASIYVRTDAVFGWIQGFVPDVNGQGTGGGGGGGGGNPPKGFCAESAGVGATGFGMVFAGGLLRRRRKSR